jgi:hypothetical protein
MTYSEIVPYIRHTPLCGYDESTNPNVTCHCDRANILHRLVRETEAAHRVMQVLGPEIPKDVDYTNPGNLSGLMYEVESALSILRDAKISYVPRKTPTVS